MKEAFWGVLIVLLGLFGIVVVNVFQNVTVDNDRVYYLIKESTEAAAFDALDLSYYRLTGDLRIVEDKFVENLTRRFAENVTIGDYTIIVEDINELPPKISLRVRSGITSLRGEEFGIVNRVDAILETKYSLDEVLEFLDITEEEWEQAKDEEAGEGNSCKAIDLDEEQECMPGDLKFIGFKDSVLQNAVCQDETPRQNVSREAEYKVCECGKWKDKTESISTNPVRTGNDWVYTWTFNKTGEIRNINESISKRVPMQICTIAIGTMVPNDINNTLPKSDGSSYEPSADNTNYVACPVNGIRVPLGMKFTIHPNYIPPLSINRNLTWTSSDTNILGIQSTNPAANCVLNANGTNCFSKAIVTAKNVGTSYINVKTTRGQTASCKVEVFDGNVDSLSCENLSTDFGIVKVMKRNYSPINATNTNFKWSISDTSIASIDEKTGEVMGIKAGSATVTVTAPNGKKGTCTLTINNSPTSSGGSSGGGAPSGGGCSCPYEEYTYERICETITYTDTCGSYPENYTFVCGTKQCYVGAGKYVSCNKYCSGTRYVYNYCEKERDVCRYETTSVTKYASGGRIVESDTTTLNGKTCVNWTSYCHTSKKDCDFISGSSCW